MVFSTRKNHLFYIMIKIVYIYDGQSFYIMIKIVHVYDRQMVLINYNLTI